MIQKAVHKKNFVHIGFEIGLMIKGANGLAEIAGGILMLFLNPARLNALLAFLTKKELAEDPTDKIANLILHLGHTFSHRAQIFGCIYLLSHGLIKCGLVFLLWRKKWWAYPLTIVSLFLFIAYQVQQYLVGPSFFLILLTLFDLAMIVLTFLEYRSIRRARPSAAAEEKP